MKFQIKTLTLIGILLVLTADFGTAKFKKATKRDPQTPRIDKATGYCTTPECVEAASSLLQAIDPTQDPCDDFFNFACGSWLKYNPMPPEYGIYGSFDVLQSQVMTVLREGLEDPAASTSVSVNEAKAMYAACMTEADETAYISSDLAALGGWPIVAGTSWSYPGFNFNKLYNTLVRYSAPGIVECFVDQDLKNSSLATIYLDQPYLGLGRDYLIDMDTYPDVVAAYKDFIESSARALGQTNEEIITADAANIISFESTIAQFSASDDDRRNYTVLYNKMTIDQLQALAGLYFDWLPFFQSIFNQTTITGSTIVVVPEPQYLKSVDTFLALTDTRTIVNYMLWRYTEDFAGTAGGALGAANDAFNQALSGTTETQASWLHCASFTDNNMGFATGRLFVESAFSEEAKTEASNIVEGIRTSFIANLPSLAWMDDATRAQAQIKAEAIRKFIGYPDWCLNDTTLDEYYQYFVIGNVNYINARNSNMGLIKKMLEALGQPVNRDRWIMSPATVNAGYLPTQNSITFPAGIIQPPFFRVGRLTNENYGGYGTVSGHELTHGFDDEGSQFDKDGNLANWWSPESKANFDALTQCFVDQYSNYCPPELAGGSTPVCLNGLQTLGENMADNGGVKEAFDAYQQWVLDNGAENMLPGLENYTSNQLFFISYANVWCEGHTDAGLLNQILYDPHSPGHYRVIGPLSNSVEFVNTFSCQGKPMDRGANACVAW